MNANRSLITVSWVGLIAAALFAPRLATASSNPIGAQMASIAAQSSPPSVGYGYYLVANDGTGYPMGDAVSLGAAPSHLSQPIVGGAPACCTQLPLQSFRGYWLVAADGGVFTFGGLRFYGSTGGTRLNQPIVGMAATPDLLGYWLVAADGGVFSFGDATFYGSTGGLRLNQPIVGMAATDDGKGYWLVAADGGVFSFGDATFEGSTGDLHLNQPIVGILPGGGFSGYLLAEKDGSVFESHSYYEDYPTVHLLTRTVPVQGVQSATPVIEIVNNVNFQPASFSLVTNDGRILAPESTHPPLDLSGQHLAHPIVGLVGGFLNLCVFISCGPR